MLAETDPCRPKFQLDFTTFETGNAAETIGLFTHATAAEYRAECTSSSGREMTVSDISDTSIITVDRESVTIDPSVSGTYSFSISYDTPFGEPQLFTAEVVVTLSACSNPVGPINNHDSDYTFGPVIKIDDIDYTNLAC